jgi:hypothetical protein
MNPFFTETKIWPAGTTIPHVYVLPDLSRDTELAALVDRIRTGMTAYRPTGDSQDQGPIVQPVQDRWLHATVQRLGGRDGITLDHTQRDRLGDALHERLALVPAFTMTAGSAIVGGTGVVLDLDQDLPGQPWEVLSGAVRDAITAVLGSGAVADHRGPPHLSIGYGRREADSGPLQSRLRRIRPARAQMSVKAVVLVDVTQDPEAGEYRWRQVSRVPLSTSVADR